MEKNDPIRAIYQAALYPQRRGEMISRALQEVLATLPAVGTALVWPCQDRKVPWKVYYAGIHPESIRRWLAARLDCSLDTTLAMLQQDLSKLSDMPFPHIICLQPASMFSAGLWIVWTSLSSLSGPTNNYAEEIRHTLEALIEVESSEMHYFYNTSPLSNPALIEALGQGDSHALSVFLSFACQTGKAELAAWGKAYHDVIETADQVGARQRGFGFTIPRGKGVHGPIITSGSQIVGVDDYRNFGERYPKVRDIVDSEGVRSVLALPVHTHQAEESSEQIAGILYITRRTVKPFSLAEQLLLQRMVHSLEPLPPPSRPPSFLAPGLPPVLDQKAAWYKLIMHANHIESLETWIDQFIKGSIIVTDSDGRPYVSARSEPLERLLTSLDSSIDGVQVISLEAPGVPLPGQVYLRSAIALPPAEWPDFFADLVVACNLIIGRMEQARDQLAYQREQWLRTVLREKPLTQGIQATAYLCQEGYRLGLPIEEGQLWVIAWPSQRTLPRQAARQRMLAENMVLDQLKSSLLFLGDDIGVILLDKDIEPQPSRLREALVTLFAPYPHWIIHGARYHSLHDLKTVLSHSISQAQQARREGHSENLLDVQALGLESLLANSRQTEDLLVIATKLLTPLLEYDRSKGTDLTITFVLTQTLGTKRAVSDQLGVHITTIRSRLRKAEDLLGIEDASPEQRHLLAHASFIWMHFHPLE